MREGWEICELQKHIKLIDYRGRTPKKTDSGVKLITAKNVKLGYLQEHPEEFIAEDNYGEWMRRGIPEYGDVIFTTEAPLANVAQLLTHEKVAFAQRTIVMQPAQEVLDKTFLKFLLLSPQTRDDIFSNGTGATVTGIKSSLLKKIQIPIPPLTEQKQIVAILEQAFAAIDLAKANIEKNIQNAKELFQSKLNEIFSQKGDGWEEKAFGEVCEIIGGSQPPKDNFIYEPREGYIRLIQVRDYKTDKYITYIPREKAKKFCSVDDIMIGRYGPPIFGIFSGIEGAYNVALMKAIPDEEKLDKEFFRWFLKTSDLVRFVEKTSKRAAGQDGVRKERLYQYRVPIPPIHEQQRIVPILGSLSVASTELESNYSQKLSNLEKLKKSILQKAFAGELTSATLRPAQDGSSVSHENEVVV